MQDKLTLFRNHWVDNTNEGLIHSDEQALAFIDLVQSDARADLLQQIKELKRDKERLDWLENCYDWQLRPTPTTFIGSEFEKSLRKTIDSAIANEKAESEKGQ